MDNLYRNNIIKNVRKLIEIYNVKTKTLADAISMDCSNFSNALSYKQTREFTLKQLISIANYFNVSIDYLISDRNITSENKEFTSNYELATLITGLVESHQCELVDYVRKETYYKPDYEFNGAITFYSEQKEVERKYTAIIFPKQQFFDYKNSTIKEICEMEQQWIREGNDEQRNVEMNKFLKSLSTIYSLYCNDEIDKSSYSNMKSGLMKFDPKNNSK